MDSGHISRAGEAKATPTALGVAGVGAGGWGAEDIIDSNYGNNSLSKNCHPILETELFLHSIQHY